MQQNYQSGDACCFTGRGPGMDPTAVDNVVMAGEVSSDGSCGFAPVIICGIFAFCRYIEQENEFLIV